MTEQLSPRERQVLALVVEGLNNREIAARLSTSEKTVKVQLSRVLRKVEARDRIGLIVAHYRAEIAMLTGAPQATAQLEAWPGEEHPE